MYGEHPVCLDTATRYLGVCAKEKLPVPASVWGRKSNPFLAKRFTAAKRTTAAQVERAYPITSLFVLRARALLCTSRGRFYQRRDHLYWCVVALAYFFQLRASELCGKHALFRADAIFLVRGSDGLFGQTLCPRRATCVGLQLHSSKTDTCKQTVQLSLHESGHPVLCPVAVLREVVSFHAGGWFAQEPASQRRRLFPGVTYDQLESFLANVAESLSIRGRKVTSQGMRRGATSTLFAQGLATDEIRRLGRWARDSDAVYAYQDRTVEGTRGIAQRLVVPVSIL